MAASLVFRLHDRGPELVREVLLERGWEEYDGRRQEQEDWNLYWRGSTFPSSDYHNLLPWQRLNHHPKTAGITRKDSLVRNLRRMRATFGPSLYDFSPTSFILPNDYTRFLAEYNGLRLTNGPAAYWICKPVDLSRGRGIFIFKDIKDLLYDAPVIVQRYVSSPLLISGYKFDLRIYVCVKSFHPLTVYIHQEGLVRFATEKYNLRSLSNLYAHLTNTSINKFGPFYKAEKGKVGQGCKWTMSKFRHFLQGQDVNECLLWQRINNIVTLTLLTIASSVPPCPNCVELFGFDVLIDSTFRPWLLEVNYSPALTLDCQADVSVKKGLIGDLIDLMNYTSTDVLRDRAYQVSRHRQPRFNTLPLLSALKQNKLNRKKKPKKAPKILMNQSRLLAKADYQRYLPAVVSRYRSVPAGEGGTGQTFNWILGPQSKTNLSVVNGQTDPADASRQTKTGLQDTEVTNRDDAETKAETELPEDADVSFSTPGAPCRGSDFKASADSWRLPNIYSRSQRPKKVHAGERAVPNTQHVPPVRVGGFVRTCPFNAATMKASQHQLDVTVIVQELQKLTGRFASGQEKENVGTRGATAEKDRFGSLLWGPQDPPRLSRAFKPA